MSRASYYIADPPSKSQPVFGRLRKDAQYPQVSRGNPHAGPVSLCFGEWSSGIFSNLRMARMLDAAAATPELGSFLAVFLREGRPTGSRQY